MQSLFENLPKRTFLDSSVLQTLEDYGEYVYDEDKLKYNSAILKTPNGLKNLKALRYIMQVSQRANFEFALSENSLNEVYAKHDVSYIQWAHEMLSYWIECINSYENDDAISGSGRVILKRINEKEFGYLSAKDKLLIFDAVLFECDTFLTMEDKLAKNTSNTEKILSLKILRPFEYWKVLNPFAALFY